MVSTIQVNNPANLPCQWQLPPYRCLRRGTAWWVRPPLDATSGPPTAALTSTQTEASLWTHLTAWRSEEQQLIDPSRCGFNFESVIFKHTLIARFMGPTWGLPGANRSQVGPMLAPWSLLSRYPNVWYLQHNWRQIQHWFGLPAGTATSHYPTQCWIKIYDAIWNHKATMS